MELGVYQAPVGVVRPDTWARPAALIFVLIAVEFTSGAALAVGPSLREYAPVDYMAWSSVIVLFPLIVLGGLLGRFASLRTLARAHRREGIASFAFASGAFRNSPGVMEAADQIGAGCIYVDKNANRIRVVTESNKEVGTFDASRLLNVERGELLGRWIFMPMLYIEFESGQQLLAWIVHADGRDFVGIGRGGIARIAERIAGDLTWDLH